MTLKNKHLEVEVVGYGGSQPVHVVGRFDNPGESFTGKFQIDGKTMHFDPNLFAALAVKQPEGCRALQMLNPDGTFDFVLRSHLVFQDFKDPSSPHSFPTRRSSD